MIPSLAQWPSHASRAARSTATVESRVNARSGPWGWQQHSQVYALCCHRPTRGGHGQHRRKRTPTYAGSPGYYPLGGNLAFWVARGRTRPGPAIGNDRANGCSPTESRRGRRDKPTARLIRRGSRVGSIPHGRASRRCAVGKSKDLSPAPACPHSMRDRGSCCAGKGCRAPVHFVCRPGRKGREVSEGHAVLRRALEDVALDDAVLEVEGREEARRPGPSR